MAGLTLTDALLLIAAVLLAAYLVVIAVLALTGPVCAPGARPGAAAPAEARPGRPRRLSRVPDRPGARLPPGRRAGRRRRPGDSHAALDPARFRACAARAPLARPAGLAGGAA